MLIVVAGLPPAAPDEDAIDFAYQVASDKLAFKLATIDTIDAKLGVVIGTLVALAALYASTSKTALAALVLLVPAAAAALGYASRNWANPPNPIRLTAYVNRGKQRMQEEALAVILKALSTNDRELKKKTSWFNRSLWLSLVAVVVLILLTALLPKSS
jgi:hypothetical protein